nr:protein prenyltransferase alpha subunit repeat-containing protein 1 [Tanacetum cinerariifolium]
MSRTLDDSWYKRDLKASPRNSAEVCQLWKSLNGARLIKRYIGREALWLYRRFLSMCWIKHFASCTGETQMDSFLDNELHLFRSCTTIANNVFEDYQSQAMFTATYLTWLIKDRDSIMERFSFAYAFSLVETLMSLYGFHKDETICILAGRPIVDAAMANVSFLICLLHLDQKLFRSMSSISSLPPYMVGGVGGRDGEKHREKKREKGWVCVCGGFYDNCLMDRMLCVLIAYVELMARSQTERVIAAMDVWHIYRMLKSDPAMVRKQTKELWAYGEACSFMLCDL